VGRREIEVLREFSDIVGSLPYCHSEIRDGKTIYQASSPDEAALVAVRNCWGMSSRYVSNGTRTIPHLNFFAGPETQVGVRSISGHATRIPNSQRCEFNSTRTDVQPSFAPRGQNQVVIAKVLIRSSLTAGEEPVLYGEDTSSSRGTSVLCFSCQISVQRLTDVAGLRDGRTRTLCLAFRIYRKQSTSNGRLFMTGQLLRSTAVAMRSMRQQS